MPKKAMFWSLIREDMRANGDKRGVAGFVIGIVLSPGFTVALLYRLSNACFSAGSVGRVFAKVFWRANVHFFGCYLSPTAVIGGGLKLPHPVAVVVGEGAVVGRRVTLYQSVTLGRDHTSRYPDVGDDCVIYPGAVVVGNVRVGSGAVIGANSFVKRNVPQNRVAVGAPARVLHVSSGQEDVQIHA